MIELSKVEKDAKFKFVEVTFLNKVEKSILNAAGTSGGNLTELKKTTEIDGTQRVFVSGNSVKWSIKQYWRENPSLAKQISPVEEKIEKPKASKSRETSTEEPAPEKKRGAQISSACDPEQYIDDDLFGYFNANKGRARNAPVKTNGMISLFDVKTDIDNLVRYSPTSDNHSLFDKEISTNVFRSSWAIELDRIGKTEGEKETEKKINLENPNKEQRVKLFFDAIFNIWQRTQQTNYLTNPQPEVMTVIFRNDKSLTVGNKLAITTNYELEIDALKEILYYHDDKIILAYLAAHKSFIKNFDKLEELNGSLDGKIIVSDLNILKEKLLSDQFNFIRE